ncbi:MAG: hypothetical protein E6G35_05550 [Actinobacteria bacterium]|nr:MAG: hypothetical protein E6G35_05550 [Actinomycetota bacterium]
MNTHRSSQLDRATADALLRGDPGVRRRAGRLGEHLAAAAAPARPAELAGLPTALAAFQAAGRHPATDLRRPSVLKTWLTKVLTIKAAALLAVTAAGGVALAATTGTLPNPLHHPSAASASENGDHPGRPSTTPSHPGKGGSAAPSPSLVGLCHAYTAGAGSDHGKALESPAFTALITAAGGKDKVDGFCTATLASVAPSTSATPDHPGDGNHPSPNPSKDKDHPTGPPSDHPSSHPSH